jgi:hypothetical protein
MALNVSNLKNDIKDAFQHGLDGGTSAEVAQFLAHAIVSYASEAEILVSGPVIIPPPVSAPSSANGRKVKVTTAASTILALQTQIANSLTAGDQYALMSSGIIAYAATSFTNFADPSIGTCPGAALMAIPPVFAPVIAAGMAATSDSPVIEKTSDIMSKIIHASFLSTMFTGVCTAVDLGVGPAIGPLM